MKYRELYDLAKSQNPHLDIQVYCHTIASIFGRKEILTLIREFLASSPSKKSFLENICQFSGPPDSRIRVNFFVQLLFIIGTDEEESFQLYDMPDKISVRVPRRH